MRDCLNNLSRIIEDKPTTLWEIILTLSIRYLVVDDIDGG